MNCIKFIGLCLVALLPVTSFAASTTTILDERALRDECSAFSQAGMRECVEKEAVKSQKALQMAEKKAVNTLSKWDKKPKHISLAKANLIAANQDFARYRDTQCKFAASLGAEAAGNALEIQRLACVTELNNRRTNQLRDAISDLHLK
ncbi:lysozyme inhibitor LprI family protein [Snodgrassella gandavensis]|uniref:lysozyme inhibitor LprI family protein n=1 Tax=Snodgrassella gandavensis TaxID=2946698 RepID=UPI001EF69993|nr:lysozyme inhibitor LprI family protein [Snodgrassella gandavensis]